MRRGDEASVFGVHGVLQAHRGSVPRHGYHRGDDGGATIDEAHVYELLGERLEAKVARDYGRADRARERLREMGVDVFDTQRMWRVRDSDAKELNAHLAALANTKRLSACRAAFAAAEVAGTVNTWSYAILVNAHATCGDAQSELIACT